MSTVVVLGRRGSGWPTFFRSMGIVFDLTGATNRRNLAALQRRRDWDALSGDLDRVFGDYRSAIEGVANSEDDNAKRAMQSTSQQADRDALIEAVCQVLAAQSADMQREILKKQSASSLRLSRKLRAASTAEARVATSDPDVSRHERV